MGDSMKDACHLVEIETISNDERSCRANEFIITIPDFREGDDFLPCTADVEQDISLAEFRDLKADLSLTENTDMNNDLEAGIVRSVVDTGRVHLWKGLADQGKQANLKTPIENSKMSSHEESGYQIPLTKEIDTTSEMAFRRKLDDMQSGDTKAKELNLGRSMAKDSFSISPGEKSMQCDGADKVSRTSKLDETLDVGVKEKEKFNPRSNSVGIRESSSFILKGNEGKGRTSEDRLHALKVPQAVVAFAQAAAKVNDLPGWPLLSPSKSQMQKCDKCSRDFCSSLNYRRHIRLHRRSVVENKDLRNERSQLAAYWNKLTTHEASEIVSFNNLLIENLSGASAAKALDSFIQQPGLLSLPQAYVKAGSLLLDIVKNRGSAFPLPADDLLKALDDASEGTFLCGGTALAVQRFIYHGDAGKVGLEDTNVVASMSFLVECKLVKAWMAEKDAEAMRCERALVEEEEAAQRKRAKILERKRQKKIKQKGSKEKELKGADQIPNLDSELGDDEVNSPRTVEEDDYSLPTGSTSSSVVSSGHDLQGADVEVTDENGYLVLVKENNMAAWDTFSGDDASNHQAFESVTNQADNEVIVNGPCSEGVSSRNGGDHNEASNPKQEPEQQIEDSVDLKIGRGRRWTSYLSSSTFHRTRREVSALDGSFQSYFKPRRIQHSVRGDTGSQQHYRKKLSGPYRGLNGENGRVVWTRKVSQPNREKDSGSEQCTYISQAVEDTVEAEGDISSGEILHDVSPTFSGNTFDEISSSPLSGRGAGVPTESLLIGSLSVPLGNYAKSLFNTAFNPESGHKVVGDVNEATSNILEGNHRVAISDGSRHEGKQASSPSLLNKVAPVKVWRAVGKIGEHNGTEIDRSSLVYDGDDSDIQTQKKGSNAEPLVTERTFPPILNVVVARPTADDVKDYSSGTEVTEVCSIDLSPRSPSPTSKILAKFLSQRWTTAIETASNETSNDPGKFPGRLLADAAQPKAASLKPDRSYKKSVVAVKTARIWPVNEQGVEGVVGENEYRRRTTGASFDDASGDTFGVVASQGRIRNFANSCGKALGRWQRNSKEKHAEQRYMPRQQISLAQQ